MPGKKKSVTGRKTIYSPEYGEWICSMLYEVEGEELPLSLRQICKRDDTPALSTVLRWLKEDDKPEFKDHYAQARELRMDVLRDRYLYLSELAIVRANGDNSNAKVQATKVQMDAIKWIMSKEYARNYGDMLKQEISGPNGAPLETKSSFKIQPEDEEAIKRIADISRRVKE